MGEFTFLMGKPQLEDAEAGQLKHDGPVTVRHGSLSLTHTQFFISSIFLRCESLPFTCSRVMMYEGP